LADQGEEILLGISDGLLSEQDVAAGVGDPDFGGEHIEIRGDPDLFSILTFVEEAFGKREGKLTDFELLAAENDIVVSQLGGANNREDLRFVIEVGAIEAETRAIDGSAVDGGAEPFEQLLTDGECEVGIVGRIRGYQGRV